MAFPKALLRITSGWRKCNQQSPVQSNRVKNGTPRDHVLTHTAPPCETRGSFRPRCPLAAPVGVRPLRTTSPSAAGCTLWRPRTRLLRKQAVSLGFAEHECGCWSPSAGLSHCHQPHAAPTSTAALARLHPQETLFTEHARVCTWFPCRSGFLLFNSDGRKEASIFSLSDFPSGCAILLFLNFNLTLET